MACVVLWFRTDLRVEDNPALLAAATEASAKGLPLLPVFFQDPSQLAPTRWGPPRMGPHRLAWLEASLLALDTELQARGSRLVVLSAAPDAIGALLESVQAVALHAEALHAPHEQDEALSARRAATQLQIECHWHESSNLFRVADLPWQPAKLPDVFTAFRQGVEQAGVPPREVIQAPGRLPAVPDLTALTDLTARLSSQAHAAAPDDRTSFPFHRPECAAGEAGAQAHLRRYLQRRLPHSYKATRNQLSGLDFSSKFSPWLATGALSAAQAMAALKGFEAEHGASDGSYWLWFELLWREHFRLLHLKHGRALYRARGLSRTPTPPPPHDPAAFQRWCEGRTGEPLVDAGMRELAATGWLSNRMRQIVASHLIHDLACDWRAGAAWFESRLIDFDVHSNQGNWLYVAGRGTDPRGGRRFNPDKQTREHDPDGRYRQLWGTA